MRLQQLHKRKRNDLIWYGVGFVLIQLGLAVGVETCWTGIRDPDYYDLQRIIRERQAESPGRRLVLALGSSRTLMALRAEALNRTSDESAPLVINCAVAGGGPMLHQVFLRRMLSQDIRPDRVVIEAAPLFLSARKGSPTEERLKLSGRYTLSELIGLDPYYAQSYRLFGPWLQNRLLPCVCYQGELHDSMEIDLAAAPCGSRTGRDRYGWLGCPRTFTPEEVENRTSASLKQYETALTQSALAPGAVQALRDGVQLCLTERIAVVLIVPAESSRFRSFAPAVAESQMNAVRGLGDELGVPLIDARTWVEDEGFYDGHHVTYQGADQYTERFRREVLDWAMSSDPISDRKGARQPATD